MTRIISSFGLVLALAAVPAVAQQSAAPQNNAAAAPAAGDPDYAALTQKLSSKNKELTDQVNAQKALVKKNQDLLKEAQRLDASNKKLENERQQLAQQNEQLQKQRDALNNGQAAPAAPAK